MSGRSRACLGTDAVSPTSLLLAPGVTQDPRGLTSSSNGDLAFGGVRGYQSSYLVDGAHGFTTFGRSSFLPRRTREHRLHLAETLSLETGRHSWKFGGDVLTTQNSYSPAAERGPSVTGQRHRFVFSWLAEPRPFDRGHESLGGECLITGASRGFAPWAAVGWQRRECL